VKSCHHLLHKRICSVSVGANIVFPECRTTIAWHNFRQ